MSKAGESSIPTQAGSYGATADELTQRIVQLIFDHPEVADIKNAWDLFHIEGFDCSDLEPSYFQAMWALAKAKGLHKYGQTRIQTG